MSLWFIQYIPVTVHTGKLIDKLVVLRMNLKFMIHCRKKNGNAGNVSKVVNEVGNDEEIYANEYE